MICNCSLYHFISFRSEKTEHLHFHRSRQNQKSIKLSFDLNIYVPICVYFLCLILYFYEEKYNHSHCLLACALQQSKYSRQLPCHDGLDHQAVSSSACFCPSLISLVWTTVFYKFILLYSSSLLCYSWWKAALSRNKRIDLWLVWGGT